MLTDPGEPALGPLVRLALLVGRGLPEPVRHAIEDDVVSMAGCSHRSGRPVRDTELAVSAVVVSASELTSRRHAGHLPTLFPIGGVLTATGALLIAGAISAFPTDVVSHPLSFVVMALAFTVIAVAFLTSATVPMRVTSVGSLIVAVTMVVQGVAGTRTVPADYLIDGACAVAGLTIPLSWLPLLVHRPLAWSALPGLVRSSRLLTIGWWGQCGAALLLAAGGLASALVTVPVDPTMSRAGSSEPVLAAGMVAGIVLQSIGALLLSSSVAGVVRPSRA